MITKFLRTSHSNERYLREVGKTVLNIFGKKHAFDSTTIPLCIAIFPWTKFRNKKGDVKAHVLYDIETQVHTSIL